MKYSNQGINNKQHINFLATPVYTLHFPRLSRSQPIECFNALELTRILFPTVSTHVLQNLMPTHFIIQFDTAW